ncbi:putative toxin biosynthesis protein [Diplodia seriata]|uniref:Putative toxin biosynthesis protein n=1 Tax=Diplodia seriata TaxID=420778 RepID=A0A0G2G4N4_9PEZI|nr:putative toxin biosynthesis protein [Diplodia seriata]
MIHAFRDEIVQPIIGIGHGMGAISLVSLAILHPPLLQTLILIDPTIHDRRMLTVDADAGNEKPDPTPISVNPSARRCCPRIPTAWPPRSPATATTDDPIKKHEDDSRSRRRAHGPLEPTYIDHTLNTSTSTTAAAAAVTPPPPSPAARQRHLNTELSPILTFHPLPSLQPSVLYIFGTNAHHHAPTTAGPCDICSRRAEQDAIVNSTGVGSGDP